MRAADWIRAQQDGEIRSLPMCPFQTRTTRSTRPGKYWDMYDPDDFEVELPYEAHQNPTPPMQWMDDQWQQGNSARTKTTARRLGDQQLREAMALTAGMITMIDDEVGRLIEVLKDTGQYDNTVICFNSDHGDYLGDFSLLLKGAMPFRSVTDVPMIWSDPASREGRVTEALASTIDLSATILDRVGLAPYNGMQGQSFMPVINGADTHRGRDVRVQRPRRAAWISNARHGSVASGRRTGVSPSIRERRGASSMIWRQTRARQTICGTVPITPASRRS